MISSSVFSAIDKIWPMMTIFLVVVITVRIAYLRTNSKKFVFYNEILLLIFIIYLLLLFELVTNKDVGNGGVNLVPFTEIFRYDLDSKLFIYNVIGNALVFVPFGFFISYIIGSKKIGQVFLITLLTSLTIELVQMRIGRAFDIDDIILNVIGGVIGYFIYKLLSSIKKSLPNFLQKDIFYNILIIILLILVLLFVAKYLGFWW